MLFIRHFSARRENNVVVIPKTEYERIKSAAVVLTKEEWRRRHEQDIRKLLVSFQKTTTHCQFFRSVHTYETPLYQILLFRGHQYNPRKRYKKIKLLVKIPQRLEIQKWTDEKQSYAKNLKNIVWNKRTKSKRQTRWSVDFRSAIRNSLSPERPTLATVNIEVDTFFLYRLFSKFNAWPLASNKFWINRKEYQRPKATTNNSKKSC